MFKNIAAEHSYHAAKHELVGMVRMMMMMVVMMMTTTTTTMMMMMTMTMMMLVEMTMTIMVLVMTVLMTLMILVRKKLMLMIAVTRVKKVTHARGRKSKKNFLILYLLNAPQLLLRVTATKSKEPMVLKWEKKGGYFRCQLRK